MAKPDALKLINTSDSPSVKIPAKPQAEEERAAQEEREANLNRLMNAPHSVGVNKEDWKRVHPNLIIMAIAYLDYCELLDLNIMFTSIIRPMIPGISTSKTHEEGRAFDSTVQGWDYYSRKSIVFHFNKNYKSIAAISSSTLVPTAVKDHIGTGPHFHFQVRP